MKRKSTPWMDSRTILVLPVAFILVVAAIPWLTDWLETGHWPSAPREYITELVGSGVTLLLGWWILTLIWREHGDSIRYFKELETLTLTDPLTGLGNRRALERDLPIALRRAERQGDPLALLYMDVDQLKTLNDRHGHALGDETLRALGAVLRSNSRVGTDTAYRVGGDEFVMTLVTDARGADLLAERVKKDFAARSPKGSHLSLGVVAWDGRMSAGQMLDEADTRMYESRLPGWSRQRA
jgi:diguanylate cyclase (GGDEF)-like protein